MALRFYSVSTPGETVVNMGEPDEPTRDEITLVGVLHALSDPTRLAVVGQLTDEGEMLCGALHVSVAKSTLSQHLRVLREAGLVEVRTDAQRRVYRLRTEPLREIDEWLAPYRAAWAGRLGALEAHLDDMDN